MSSGAMLRDGSNEWRDKPLSRRIFRARGARLHVWNVFMSQAHEVPRSCVSPNSTRRAREALAPLAWACV